MPNLMLHVDRRAALRTLAHVRGAEARHWGLKRQGGEEATQAGAFLQWLPRLLLLLLQLLRRRQLVPEGPEGGAKGRQSHNQRSAPSSEGHAEGQAGSRYMSRWWQQGVLPNCGQRPPWAEPRGCPEKRPRQKEDGGWRAQLTREEDPAWRWQAACQLPGLKGRQAPGLRADGAHGRHSRGRTRRAG